MSPVLRHKEISIFGATLRFVTCFRQYELGGAQLSTKQTRRPDYVLQAVLGKATRSCDYPLLSAATPERYRETFTRERSYDFFVSIMKASDI